jgi:hypothetical protein
MTVNDLRNQKVIVNLSFNGESLYFQAEEYHMARMSMGNMKLDKSIAIFSLPAVRTCLNCSSCAKTCYARKAERMYPKVRKFRNDNLTLVTKYRDTFVMMINHQIKSLNVKTVRIHESGDFFSQDYLDMWTSIIRENPKTRFYAYTKVVHLLDFSEITGLHNFNLVKSVLPDGDKNYGDLMWLNNKLIKYDIPVCPATMRKGVKCGKDCQICVYNEYVLFKQH